MIVYFLRTRKILPIFFILWFFFCFSWTGGERTSHWDLRWKSLFVSQRPCFNKRIDFAQQRLLFEYFFFSGLLRLNFSPFFILRGLSLQIHKVVHSSQRKFCAQMQKRIVGSFHSSMFSFFVSFFSNAKRVNLLLVHKISGAVFFVSSELNEVFFHFFWKLCLFGFFLLLFLLFKLLLGFHFSVEISLLERRSELSVSFFVPWQLHIEGQLWH